VYINNTKPKRYGQPKARYGQIKIQWGYTKDDGEDTFMCYGGHTGGRRDVRLVMSVLNEKRYSFLDNKFESSLLQELEDRGYDIKTLKFSIEEKDENLDD
jgi:hypothetical protein